MVTAVEPEPAWFPSAPEETAPVLELNITLTFSDPADEHPWFAECLELPLTGEGATPREAVSMLLEMAELYLRSLHETGRWQQTMAAAGLDAPQLQGETDISIAVNVRQSGTVELQMGSKG